MTEDTKRITIRAFIVSVLIAFFAFIIVSVFRNVPGLAFGLSFIMAYVLLRYFEPK